MDSFCTNLYKKNKRERSLCEKTNLKTLQLQLRGAVWVIFCQITGSVQQIYSRKQSCSVLVLLPDDVAVSAAFWTVGFFWYSRELLHSLGRQKANWGKSAYKQKSKEWTHKKTSASLSFGQGTAAEPDNKGQLVYSITILTGIIFW